jgi:glyoxylase-like metal-dependent hydrolase (beta-lactamase superfamily II)
MIQNLARGVQAFTSNVFLVAGDRTVLVDAGANFDVTAAVRDHVDDLDALVLTHTHRDHVDNADAITETFDVPVFGFDDAHPAVDEAIADEATLTLGDHEYTALHTPGHKDDHLCFHAPEPGVLFVGDLVFANGGFGRTDLAEGDRDRLIESIDRLRDALDDDLAVMYPGHGPAVTERPFEDVELAARAARMR